MTLAKFNEEIKKQFPHVTMYRGKGYQYFLDDRDEYYDDIPSMFICYLYQLTLREVLSHISFHVKNNQKESDNSLDTDDNVCYN